MCLFSIVFHIFIGLPTSASNNNFVVLRGNSNKFTFTLCYRLEEHERAITIIGKAITIERAIESRSHECKKIYTKYKAKRLIATTFVLAKLEECKLYW